MVLSERIKGITQLRILPWNKEGEHYIDFGEDAFLAYTSINPDFKADLLRIGYTSMTTPNTTYDYDVKNRSLEVKKQQEVVGDFDSKNYTSERIYAKAKDGTEIPISLVYRNGFKKDGKQPLLLYAYGSYGSSMDPYFSSVRLSLLDRGFAYAIAHIRGGEEMGRYWYEEGKLLNKKNTFTDFIDCADYLIDKDYTNKDKLFAMGGSAGGLLMGAVVNMRPELWRGVIAAVPFVDVVTTMLDETIPLTTGEYDEWGNPNVKEYYDYIKSYSPYDNVEAKDYPSIMVTTGYHDSQVQYWEPAKWVAKLRELKTDNKPLLMYCNMETGHGGASGRFARYKETAMEYAYLLDLAGIE
jgi:oligopeptidase B